LRFTRKLRKIYANIAAARGKTKEERRRIRRDILGKYREDFAHQGCDCTALQVSVAMQDMNFPLEVREARRLIVVLVPEHNAMSGGIYSFFSIAEQMRRLRRVHGFEVVVMTRPNIEQLTYFRNTNFRNAENVYRFAQLQLCTSVEEVYIHLPEYAVDTLSFELGEGDKEFLGGRKVYINILNQNIKMMPERDRMGSVFDITPHVTQSVAHHAYYNQDRADRYGLPTLLLPAYTDLTQYPACGFNEKEKLIIYSLDESPFKDRCLAEISRVLPDFRLVEIKGVTFDSFMDLATRCMFSITFGEGFDGYLAQPIYQGGIGFAIYNDDFFPSERFKEYFNIFSSGGQMVEEICDRIKFLSSNESAYSELNAAFLREYHELYSFDEYVDQIRKLTLRSFEIFPMES